MATFPSDKLVQEQLPNETSICISFRFHLKFTLIIYYTLKAVRMRFQYLLVYILQSMSK